MDYLGDDLYPNSDTPGLISDDVSYLKQQHICLPTSSSNSLGHTRNFGETTSVAVSPDCHL